MEKDAATERRGYRSWGEAVVITLVVLGVVAVLGIGVLCALSALTWGHGK